MKACLGLTNAAPSSSRKIVTDFRCIYFVVYPHDLLYPYYEPLIVVHDKQGFILLNSTCNESGHVNINLFP